MKKGECEYKIVVTRITKVEYEDGEKLTYQNTHKKGDDGDDIWGNMPKPAHTSTTSEEVFIQRVDKVDLLALVAAINGISWK